MGSQSSKLPASTNTVYTGSASTEPVFTSGQSPRPLRILCIDGAGVRSYSSLIILQQLMTRLSNHPGGDPVCPANVFDLIIGTGTGGIIALMLGRLKMSVPDCLAHFQEIMLDLLGRGMSGLLGTGARILKGRDITWLSSSDLEMHSKRLVDLQLGDPDALMYEGKLRVNICKSAVVATDITGKEAATILRSYDISLDDLEEELAPDQVQIWEAARATSATPLIFEPISIGGKKLFVDGGAGGHSNPTQLALDEARRIWPGHPIGLLLSLGAGASIGGTPDATESVSIFDRIVTSAAEVDHQVREFVDRELPATSYIRFCPGEELASVSLGDHTAITGDHNRVQSITLLYLLRPQQVDNIVRCVSLMNMRPSTPSSTDGISEVSPHTSPDSSLPPTLLEHPVAPSGTSETVNHPLPAQSGLKRPQPAPVGGSIRTGIARGSRLPHHRFLRRSSVSRPRVNATQALVPGHPTRGSLSPSTSRIPISLQRHVGSNQAGPSTPSYMRDSPGNRSSQVIPNHTGALYDSPPNPFFLSPTLPLRSNLPPSAPGQGEEEDKIQAFENTIDDTERFRREPSAESLDNTIATGAYIIINAETKDEAALDDTHQELNLVELMEPQWSVERLSNGRYTIKNARNAMFASHETCPKEESTVYANKDAKEWMIEESRTMDQHL
ncbi:hypothetical protein RSOLAG22IIIB_09519 [Rhizoctonia solani]|uniref:PNPLA domain-containing protein n=1 Tax=Rhizoctonia solani TaxID=456999 RepID=A0A0K6FYL2_9AGAM|nr:hypothetical protein RSOLAG22IIIB_09519 [Rhizoctonia solani]